MQSSQFPIDPLEANSDEVLQDFATKIAKEYYKRTDVEISSSVILSGKNVDKKRIFKVKKGTPDIVGRVFVSLESETKLSHPSKNPMANLVKISVNKNSAVCLPSIVFQNMDLQFSNKAGDSKYCFPQLRRFYIFDFKLTKSLIESKNGSS